MVLSRSGPTAPEDLRAIVSHTLLLAGIWAAFLRWWLSEDRGWQVRPEVARREKTMVLVRDTFRRYALRWCYSYLAGYQTWTRSREVYIHTRALVFCRGLIMTSMSIDHSVGTALSRG